MRVPRGDAGLTLTEMLVGFAILGILMVPLAGSVLASLVAVDRSYQRVSDSADSQLLGMYFIHDVQSSDSVASAGACAPAGSSTVLEVGWTDPVTSATQTVAYATVVSADGPVELHRFACGAESGDITIARAVSGAVQITCKDGAGTVMSCGDTARTITVSFEDKGDAADDAPYGITMTATRRET